MLRLRIVDGVIEKGIDRSTANFERFIEAAVKRMGDLHGIVNNAGIIQDGLLVKKDRQTGAVKTLSNARWQNVLDVNLTGVFLGARAYADWHVRNEKQQGVIVSISSISRVTATSRRSRVFSLRCSAAAGGMPLILVVSLSASLRCRVRDASCMTAHLHKRYWPCRAPCA